MLKQAGGWGQSSPGNCRWSHLEKQERWVPGQPWGACELWEFKEQHIPQTSCSFSFLIEKEMQHFLFNFSEEDAYFGYNQSLFVNVAGKPKLSYFAEC